MPAHPSRTAACADQGSGSNRIVSWCAVGAGFTTLFDSATVSYVAPAAAESLAAPTSGLQWFLASYSLTFGLGLVPGGRLGDAWGRRPFFLVGLSIFLLGGLVTALAPDTLLLVSARFLQGFGAGVLSAQVMGLIQDHFTGSARMRAFAAYTAAGAAAALVGPLIAASLLSVGGGHGWRVVLLVPWISGAVTLGLAFRGLQRTARSDRVSLDTPGLCMLGMLVILALLPVLDIGLSGVANAAVLGAALTLSVVLYTWERHYARSGRLPLFAPALMGSPRFLLGNASALLWFGANLALGSSVVMYLLAEAEISPLLIALSAVAAALGRLVGARLSTVAHSRFGAAVLVVSLAFQFMVVAAVITATHFFSGTAFLVVLCALFVIHGMASGFYEPVVRSETLEDVDEGLRGIAASFLQLTQRMAASIMTAVTAGLIFSGAGVPTIGDLRAALLVCVVVTFASLVSSMALAFHIRAHSAGASHRTVTYKASGVMEAGEDPAPGELVGKRCRGQTSGDMSDAGRGGI
ncbi:MFS transporter [Corynebacterium pacaense]|uniref:MFS transporter n=1 Tax=Corynebacterium pacaense TaxID=1816684 RepID=UPI0009BB5193|nr:MFS transporter [Corynebacterium pacaense]